MTKEEELLCLVLFFVNSFDTEAFENIVIFTCQKIYVLPSFLVGCFFFCRRHGWKFWMWIFV